LNIILFFATVCLFYGLVKKLFSERIAFWAAVLLIFSPFAHSWLVQTETSIFGIFSFIFSLYLLDNYIKEPSRQKLIIFSLIVGILMLGKMNLAIGIFVGLLALWFKKYREVFIFLVLQFIPILLWYLWVTKVWGLNFGMQEVSKFGAGVWMFEMINWPLYQVIGELVGVIPNFLTSIIYGFLLIPVLFSLIGFYIWQFKYKQILFGSMLLAYLIFFFVLRLYLPRHAFFLFPIIYPTAILGIDYIGEKLKIFRFYKPWIYYPVVYFLIIAPALLSIFRIYEYLGVPYS
jgi:4-amino-4-deoxy-L-arabinose transferase-like glycosyltransferase